MSNPVNPAKNGGTINKADSKANPTETVELTDPKTPEVATAVLHPQVIEPKSANTVFERLEEGLKMKEQFNKFKEKVVEFEDFTKRYDNEGLVMKIENIGTGDNIQIQNVQMILDFTHNLVKTGKVHLKGMENEIINFTI
jgi:hypothetical protein